MPATLQREELQTRDLVAREIVVRSDSVRESDRSFEAVVATEQPATVFDFRTFDVIDEVLVAKGGEFPKSIPLLDDHQRSSGVNSILGTADRFKREGDQWVGRGVVGEAVDGNTHRQQLWRDLLGGHIRAVSIGYQVRNFVDIPSGQTQRIGGKSYTAGERTLRISTDWIVRELSLTPIGADELALIRSQHGRKLPQKGSYFAR